MMEFGFRIASLMAFLAPAFRALFVEMENGSESLLERLKSIHTWRDVAHGRAFHSPCNFAKYKMGDGLGFPLLLLLPEGSIQPVRPLPFKIQKKISPGGAPGLSPWLEFRNRSCHFTKNPEKACLRREIARFGHV